MFTTSIDFNGCGCFNSVSSVLREANMSGTADTFFLTQTTLGKGQAYLQTTVNTVIEQPRSSISLSSYISPPLPFSHLLMMCVALREGSCEGVSVGLWDGIRHFLFCSVCRVPLLLSCFSASLSLSLSIYPSITEKIHGLTALSKRVWQLCPQAIILKMTSLRRHEIINVSQQAATTQGQRKRFDLLFFFFCILSASLLNYFIFYFSYSAPSLSFSISVALFLSQWIFRDVCWFWHLSRCFRIEFAARPSAECYGCTDTHTFRHAVAV